MPRDMKAPPEHGPPREDERAEQAPEMSVGATRLLFTDGFTRLARFPFGDHNSLLNFNMNGLHLHNGLPTIIQSKPRRLLG